MNRCVYIAYIVAACYCFFFFFTAPPPPPKAAPPKEGIAALAPNAGTPATPPTAPKANAACAEAPDAKAPPPQLLPPAFPRDVGGKSGRGTALPHLILSSSCPSSSLTLALL